MDKEQEDALFAYLATLNSTHLHAEASVTLESAFGRNELPAEPEPAVEEPAPEVVPESDAEAVIV